jgi:hypothetical protein
VEQVGQAEQQIVMGRLEATADRQFLEIILNRRTQFGTQQAAAVKVEMLRAIKAVLELPELRELAY